MKSPARRSEWSALADHLESSTPEGAGARWKRRLVHGFLIVFGWAVFIWSWQRVTAARPEVGELRVLFGYALLLVPVLTLSWVAHNVGIYRRKGPRRASHAVPLKYEQDFNGRHIRADWAGLQAARRIDILVAGGDKQFIAAAPSARRPSLPAVRMPDFEVTR